MFGSIIGLVALVLLVLVSVWRHDWKSVLLFGAITMFVVALTVDYVGFFRNEGAFYTQDIAYMVSGIMAIAAIILHLNAGLRRRRATSKPTPVEEPAMSHP